MICYYCKIIKELVLIGQALFLTAGGAIPPPPRSFPSLHFISHIPVCITNSQHNIISPKDFHGLNGRHIFLRFREENIVMSFPSTRFQTHGLLDSWGPTKIPRLSPPTTCQVTCQLVRIVTNIRQIGLGLLKLEMCMPSFGVARRIRANEKTLARLPSSINEAGSSSD